MYYSRLFDTTIEFDLLTSELPAHLQPHFGDQVRLARRILKNRTDTQVLHALDSLGWMLRSSARRLFSQGSLDETEFPKGKIINVTRTLLYLVHEFDIKGQPDFPKATWAEYFSIHALSYVPELLIFENFNSPQQPDSPTGLAAYRFLVRDNEDIQTLWIRESIEAISYATLYESIRSRSAHYGCQGGKTKLPDHTALRKKILSLHDEKYFELSNRDAAATIYAIMKDEIDAVLNNDDPVQQLASWIGSHVRSKRAT